MKVKYRTGVKTGQVRDVDPAHARWLIDNRFVATVDEDTLKSATNAVAGDDTDTTDAGSGTQGADIGRHGLIKRRARKQ